VEGEPVATGLVLAETETLGRVRNSVEMINVAFTSGGNPADWSLTFGLSTGTTCAKG